MMIKVVMKAGIMVEEYDILLDSMACYGYSVLTPLCLGLRPPSLLRQLSL